MSRRRAVLGSSARSCPAQCRGRPPATRPTLQWLLQWLLFATLLAAMTLAGPAPAQAQPLPDVVTIDRAWVTVRIDDRLVREREPITLPYNWDRMHSARSGEAVFEMRFSLPPGFSGPHGLYLPRVGTAAHIELNDALLLRDMGFADPGEVDYSKGPRYLRVPPELLRTDNQLRISIRADGGRRAGLSQLTLGPQDAVRPMFMSNYRLRVTASLLLTAASLIVGAIALVLWAIQALDRRPGIAHHGALYLSAGVAELCWAMRVGDVALDHPPLAWPAWGVVMTAALAGWLCGVVLFCHHFAHPQGNRRTPWLKTFMAAMFGSAVLASTASLTLHRPVFLTTWLGMANVFAAAYAVVYLAGAIRRRHLPVLMVAVAAIVNVAMGVHDWVTVRISGDYAANTLVRYSALLFALVLAYAVISQFRAVSAQASELTTQLEARIADKERELQASYRQLEALAREQERVSERARILRDMHDGVGAHISTAIRQLQAGRASTADLLQTLRDSLDQLKLSIDSMNLPTGDVTALLASLRYRLQPRLADCGIALRWQIEPLPPVALDSTAMRHLQFMVFEAVSNVLQHAQARTLELTCTHEANGYETNSGRCPTLRLRIVDDGRGFDALQPPRKGLASMRERAAAIGATMELHSAPGRTLVEFRLRVANTAVASASAPA